jgi:tetratricopeptide (TPR) repeat protein
MAGYREALAAFRSGDNQRARELSVEALAVAQRQGDRPGQVDALCMLARVALRDGDLAQVRELADQARTCARTAGDKSLERVPLHMQAVATRMSGNLSAARGLYEESIKLNRSLGAERMVAAELHNLGYVELHDGHSELAIELFTQARLEAQQIGYEALNPYLVGDLAVVAAVRGETMAAARLAGAAAAAFAAAGEVPDPDDATEQLRLRDQLARDLGPDTLSSLYAEGANLTPQHILSEATSGAP